jgi:hypothetical protein
LKAEPQFTRTFVDETEILQRELKDDVPAWSWAAASLVVLVISLSFIFALAWGLGRAAGGAGGGGVRPGPSPPRVERPREGLTPVSS